MTILMIKPDKIKFFAADWSSNGTNCLYIVDEEFKVIAGLDEALFGVNVAGSTTALEFDYIVEFDPAHEDIQIMVKELTLEEVLKHIATSPIDPKGHEAMQFVKKYLTKEV